MSWLLFSFISSLTSVSDIQPVFLFMATDTVPTAHKEKCAGYTAGQKGREQNVVEEPIDLSSEV